ncbi:MAG: GFA family protein [Rhodobacteraceae bacterium]|nr:GFA family protein [Paracoccaceae bacterium]
MKTGSCECGSVTYKLTGEMRAPTACHCTQCRKTSGHYWAATQVASDNLTITRDEGLKWYRSSDWAERGFCQNCGSSLFWRRDGAGKTSIGAGTLDGATGLNTAKHICMADKGDYYEIADGLPQLEDW